PGDPDRRSTLAVAERIAVIRLPAALPILAPVSRAVVDVVGAVSAVAEAIPHVFAAVAEVAGPIVGTFPAHVLATVADALAGAELLAIPGLATSHPFAPAGAHAGARPPRTGHGRKALTPGVPEAVRSSVIHVIAGHFSSSGCFGQVALPSSLRPDLCSVSGARISSAKPTPGLSSSVR